MAEPKTKPTRVSVDKYLQAVEPAKRKSDGIALAAIFREETGEDPVMWGPSIVGYGSYHYISQANPRTRGEWPKTGFSPRKAQLSIYGIKDLEAGAKLLPQLGKFTEGAGCVYVRKLEDIDETVLRELIRIAAARGDDPEPHKKP